MLKMVNKMLKSLLILKSLHNLDNLIGDIVQATYPNLLENMTVLNFFEERAVLAPTLEVSRKSITMYFHITIIRLQLLAPL
jgi:hypothetical protein